MSQDATTTQDVQEQQVPVFDEINEIDNNGAVNVLIQASQLAQSTGRLSVRDSVLLAKAIEILRPGTV